MTKVLVHYYHRPMCATLFYARAFRRLGCDVRTIGPGENNVYAHENWADYVPPDIVAPNEPLDVNVAIDLARQFGFEPDLVFCGDQYDAGYLIGTVAGSAKFAYLSVENVDPMQAERRQLRQADAEFYCIAHSHPHLVPPGAEWIVFGADPDVHPFGAGPRDLWVCQVGTPYEPRPTIWNDLRWRFDNAGPISQGQYMRELCVTAHTAFGHIFTYAGMADAYGRSLCAISSSNVDFIPMRASEAFAMGSILLSDDVSTMRAAFGAPYPEDPQGVWVAHDRSSLGIGNQVEYVRDMPAEERDALQQRAYALVTSKFMYDHAAKRILEKVGLGV